MAGNRKTFNRALTKWEQLHREGSFSAPTNAGKIAIISSYYTDEPLDTDTGVSELTSFRTEALALADRTHAQGLEPTVAIDASRSDITRLIQDPEVASMYIIGNGSLSTLLLGEKDYYDWRDVSDASTHLKQGLFVQRQCGGLSRTINVPMGLFAVTDMSNVHAATGQDFYPLSLDDAENDKIEQVFSALSIDYDDIIKLGSAVITNESQLYA
jgi:hypothetical protein